MARYVQAGVAESVSRSAIGQLQGRADNSRPRVLMGVEQLSSSHGVTVQSFQVAEALARRGYAIDVAYETGGNLHDRWSGFADSLEQRSSLTLPLRRPRNVAKMAISAAGAARRYRPGVIYDNAGWSLPWSRAVGLARRAPVVLHVHGFGPDETIGRSIRAMLPGTARVIAVSDFVHRRLVSDFDVDPTRVVTIHNGIDPDVYRLGGEAQMRVTRRTLGLSPDSFVVLYYGRIHPTKGVHVLLDALHRVNLHGQRLEVVILGDSDDPAYEGSLQRLAQGLRYHRLPNRADVIEVLHAADIAVVPSVWSEPLGRTVLETLASGRPVVASATGGIPEILTDSLQRFLVPPNDPFALAKSIEGRVGWRQREPELSQTCRTRIVEHFNLASFAGRLDAQLRDAGKAQRRATPI